MSHENAKGVCSGKKLKDSAWDLKDSAWDLGSGIWDLGSGGPYEVPMPKGSKVPIWGFLLFFVFLMDFS
jgi:hypothetical protein